MVIVATGALAGCGSMRVDPTLPSPPAQTAAPTVPSSSPNAPEKYSITGTGSQTIQLQIPSVDIEYLIGTWTVSPCTAGDASITMVEDPQYGISGSCDTRYQFNVPDVSTVHLTVQIPADAHFSFAGVLMPGA
jgi:hypothetical protein